MKRRPSYSSASTPPSASRADRPEAGAQRRESLMVVGADLDPFAEHRREPRSRLELDAVLGEAAGGVPVAVVADDVREMLDEIAAECDVEHLRAAADREHGEVTLDRRGEQRQLGAVALGYDPRRLGVRLLAVELGVEVGAAREDQPVERAEGLVDRVVKRRHEQRPAAGADDGADVVDRNERRGQLPDPERRRGDVRRDPDHRVCRPSTHSDRSSGPREPRRKRPVRQHGRKAETGR